MAISAPAVTSFGGVLGEMMENSLKICNCAECGKELVARRSAPQVMLLATLTENASPPGLVAGKIKGRPYCQSCLRG